jgi:NOL1/NOP2/fmu family ribosome biogenesis protein/23S rRNA U2552 (ribose-2'-O)-methylase RlmE/FtsJ
MYVGAVVEEFLFSNKIRLALDLCAAPGGKSTHLRSILPDEALLVCNEVIPSRNHVLCQSIAKWGHPGVVVTRNDAEDFPASGLQFDLVLVDAPCSGEGMFRKDPVAVSEWSMDNVKLCSLRQEKILESAVKALAPGGLLVYSTCTWSEQEDGHISRLLREVHGLERFPLPAFPGIILTDDGAEFYPHMVRGEGFFLTAYIKPSTAGAAPEAMRRKIPPSVREDPSLRLFAAKYFTGADAHFFSTGDHGWMVLSAYRPAWERICAGLHVVYSGVRISERKGREWIPAAEAALSSVLSRDLPVLDVDEEPALRYLRGETLTVDRSLGGWILVCHGGFGLGWGKAVQGRLNNAFPKEWRIRMEIDRT